MDVRHRTPGVRKPETAEERIRREQEERDLEHARQLQEQYEVLDAGQRVVGARGAGGPTEHSQDSLLALKLQQEEYGRLDDGGDRRHLEGHVEMDTAQTSTPATVGGEWPADAPIDVDVQLDVDMQLAQQLAQQMAEEERSSSAECSPESQGRRGHSSDRRGQSSNRRGHSSDSDSPPERTGRGHSSHRGSDSGRPWGVPILNRLASSFFGMVPATRTPGRRARLESDEGPLLSLQSMRGLFTDQQWGDLQAAPESLLLGLIGGEIASPAHTSYHSLSDQTDDSSSSTGLSTTADFSGDDYEMLWDLAERIGEGHDRGLDRGEIDQLPTARYDQPAPGQPASEEEAQCKICLGDYEPGVSLRRLPCCHQFHKTCIDKWIKKNAVCPICRVEIREEIQGASEYQ